VRRGGGVGVSGESEESRALVEAVCEPGHTLLWDMLQDGAITQLPDDVAAHAEKNLIALCQATDRRIRCSFIEACIRNVAHNRYGFTTLL
jgi:hypothetical protein